MIGIFIDLSFLNKKGHWMKFLIIEDEIIIADDILMTVKSEGHQITGVVSSAEEAFQSIEKNVPDAVFIDIGLRDSMNGIEISQILLEKYGLRVIFLTSFFYRIPEAAQECRPYSFIIKPVIKEEIIQSINKVKKENEPKESLFHPKIYKQETFFSEILSY